MHEWAPVSSELDIWQTVDGAAAASLTEHFRRTISRLLQDAANSPEFRAAGWAQRGRSAGLGKAICFSVSSRSFPCNALPGRETNGGRQERSRHGNFLGKGLLEFAESQPITSRHQDHANTSPDNPDQLRVFSAPFQIQAWSIRPNCFWQLFMSRSRRVHAVLHPACASQTIRVPRFPPSLASAGLGIGLSFRSVITVISDES